MALPETDMTYFNTIAAKVAGVGELDIPQHVRGLIQHSTEVLLDELQMDVEMLNSDPTNLVSTAQLSQLPPRFADRYTPGVRREVPRAGNHCGRPAQDWQGRPGQPRSEPCRRAARPPDGIRRRAARLRLG